MGGVTSCPLTSFFLLKLSNSLQSVRTQWCAGHYKSSPLFIAATILIHKGSNLWRPSLACHTIHFGAQIYKAPYKKYLTLHFGAQICKAPHKKYLTLHFGAQTCEAPTCTGCVTLHFILYHLVEANQSTHQLLEMNLKSKPLPIQNSEDDWSRPHVEHNRIMLSWLGSSPSTNQKSWTSNTCCHQP